MLYYLEKFCRICIQTGGKLTDIDSKDHDSVKFSEKLKACTQMVITRESLSTQICSSCVHKLRISYQFQNMCKKSTAILQQYLTELLSMSDDITADKFLNSELTISTTTLPKPRRKRVGKDERCSLLKKLLSRITQEQIVHNIHIKGLAKLCDQIPPIMGETAFPKIQKSKVDKSDVEILPLPTLEQANTDKNETKTSCLRTLLNFTKDFDFGYDINSIRQQCRNNFDLTPLERLAKFTENFFYDHFGDYRETILHVGENFDFDSSDDEEMFEDCSIHEEYKAPKIIKEEIVIVEPDLNLKKEMYYDECNEAEDQDSSSDYDFSSRFVQACYDSNDDAKMENEDAPTKSKRMKKQECDNKIDDQRENIVKNECIADCQQSSPKHYIAQNSCLAEIIPITQHIFSPENNNPISNNYLNHSNFPAHNFLAQTDFLKHFQDTPMSFKRHRTLSPYSVKCRTRGNPFINPQLKKQFQTRNFKCSTCSRRFKSPGYLKAHCSKLMH